MLRTRTGKQNRKGAIDRMAALLEKNLLKRLKSEGADEKEIAKHRSESVPNRAHLRSMGMNHTRRTGKPFGRLTRFRLSPPSLQTLVAIHQEQDNGAIRKIVVPRAQFENKDA